MCDVRNKYTKWIKMKYKKKKKKLLPNMNAAQKLLIYFSFSLLFTIFFQNHHQKVLLLLFILKINICFVNASNLIWPFWWHLHTLHFIRVLHFVHISALLPPLRTSRLSIWSFSYFHSIKSLSLQSCTQSVQQSTASNSTHNFFGWSVFDPMESAALYDCVCVCACELCHKWFCFLSQTEEEEEKNTKTNWFWDGVRNIYVCGATPLRLALRFI